MSGQRERPLHGLAISGSVENDLRKVPVAKGPQLVLEVGFIGFQGMGNLYSIPTKIQSILIDIRYNNSCPDGLCGLDRS